MGLALERRSLLWQASDVLETSPMNGWYDDFGFYHGPRDPRLIVPKRIPIMGWTINVSHPKAPLLVLLTCGAIGLGILAQVLFQAGR
ncbi:hypothetical protein CSW60_15100 [Caulobacter sp. X]|nr:hypothetical protein CSW60_15100 [Caulobacter sp. X]